VAACRLCNERRHRRARPPSPEHHRQRVRARIRRGRWHAWGVLQALGGGADAVVVTTGGPEAQPDPVSPIARPGRVSRPCISSGY
jgi:hypothetical protein